MILDFYAPFEEEGVYSFAIGLSKGQGHNYLVCQNGFHSFSWHLFIIPNNVSQGSGKGGICVVRHFFLLFCYYFSKIISHKIIITTTITTKQVCLYLIIFFIKKCIIDIDFDNFWFYNVWYKYFHKTCGIFSLLWNYINVFRHLFICSDAFGQLRHFPCHRHILWRHGKFMDECKQSPWDRKIPSAQFLIFETHGNRRNIPNFHICKSNQILFILSLKLLRKVKPILSRHAKRFCLFTYS